MPFCPGWGKGALLRPWTNLSTTAGAAVHCAQLTALLNRHALGNVNPGKD